MDIYPKDAHSYHKDNCSIVFTATLFAIARNWKQPRCPSIEKWIKKMWYIYTVEYYSGVKNNDILKFAGKWIRTRKNTVSEVIQTQKDNHSMYSLKSGYQMYSKRLSAYSPRSQRS